MDKRSERNEKEEFVGFLGLGLDNSDEHKRVTTGANFLLVGGSQETHERMIDTAVDVNARLQEKGKTLAEASIEEIVDLFRDSAAKRS